MVNPSILIYSNFFISMVFAIVQWISNEKNNMMTKLSYVYSIVATVLLSLCITDTLLGLVYAVIFGAIIIFIVLLSNNDLKSTQLYIFIVSVVILSIMFVFISRFVLVKSNSLMFIYFLPIVYIFNRSRNQPIKFRAIGAIGFAFILVIGLYYNNDKTNHYPTKQSLAAIEYMAENYSDVHYTVRSLDAFRGSKTVVTVLLDASPKRLMFEYDNGLIISVKER